MLSWVKQTKKLLIIYNNYFMGKMKKTVNEQIKTISIEDKKLKPKDSAVYEATLDNIIVEVFWTPLAEDAKEYVAPHMRGELRNEVISVGPDVKVEGDLIGKMVFASNQGRCIAADEFSGIYVFKAHEIAAIITPIEKINEE